MAQLTSNSGGPQKVPLCSILSKATVQRSDRCTNRSASNMDCSQCWAPQTDPRDVQVLSQLSLSRMVRFLCGGGSFGPNHCKQRWPQVSALLPPRQCGGSKRFNTCSIECHGQLLSPRTNNHRAGRQLRRGVHTTVGQPGVPLSWPFGINLRQPANSAVLHWAGKVLALYERDLPYVMDRALTTSAASRGPSTLNVWHSTHLPLSVVCTIVANLCYQQQSVAAV